MIVRPRQQQHHGASGIALPSYRSRPARMPDAAEPGENMAIHLVKPLHIGNAELVERDPNRETERRQVEHGRVGSIDLEGMSRAAQSCGHPAVFISPDTQDPATIKGGLVSRAIRLVSFCPELLCHHPDLPIRYANPPLDAGSMPCHQLCVAQVAGVIPPDDASPNSAVFSVITLQ